MPVQIQFQLSDKAANEIAAAFDRSADRDVACTEFAEVALRHFHGWITGVDRYRSLTDQYIRWVEDLYEEMLPQTEGPNINRLYNGFNSLTARPPM